MCSFFSCFRHIKKVSFYLVIVVGSMWAYFFAWPVYKSLVHRSSVSKLETCVADKVSTTTTVSPLKTIKILPTTTTTVSPLMTTKVLPRKSSEAKTTQRPKTKALPTTLSPPKTTQRPSDHNKDSPTTLAPAKKKPTGKVQLKVDTPASQKVIRILAWTDLSPGNRNWFGPNWLEGNASCDTRIPCNFTNNQLMYSTSDVVIFHTRYIYAYSEMPTRRPPGQHWITYLHEAPVRDSMSVESPYNSWFNWTYSYAMKADIVMPYGICLPNRDKLKNDPSSITDAMRKIYGKTVDKTPWINPKAKQEKYTAVDYARGKTGKVFWAVSHCNTESLREKYAAELKRHIQVDIIGGCVHNKCEKGDASCMEGMFKSHKFYLAFENAICSDYITEKTWGRLQSTVIPIVLGGADYKAYLPPHSYIDVKDYASPKDLATHLHKLDKNDKLYNEYFAWKKDYTCYSTIPKRSLVCSICSFINENMDKTNTISDINQVWSIDSCIPPNEYYRDIAKFSGEDAFSKKKDT